MKQIYRDTVEKFSNIRIAVVGDLMLDVYLWGDVNRISPEAPVPVVNIRSRTSCPGGAANVMRNIATCGGKVTAFGAVGNDVSGKELLEKLNELSIELEGIFTDSNCRTIEKCRIIAGAQQLLRADFEAPAALDETLQKDICRQVISQINSGTIDAVIFDDYAKGTLSAAMLNEIIPVARKNNVITILDPKPKAGGVPPVKGLTLLKPNRSEAFTLAKINDNGRGLPPEKDPDLLLAAEKICTEWEPEYLLISLASQGMAVFQKGKLLKIIPTMAREVFDVSGAGDTVAAVCTAAMATGCDAVTAAEIANFAAGVVVGKIGTAPIMKDELLAVLN